MRPALWIGMAVLLLASLPSGGSRDEANSFRTRPLQRFLQSVVDRAVLEHYSRSSALPLSLAALPEHHHLFNEVSQNPLLGAEGIQFNPDAVSADDLGTLAWQVMEPQVSRAAGFARRRIREGPVQGRRQRRPREGRRGFRTRAGGDPSLLEDLGELVVKKGGSLLVIPADQLPTTTGLAATYRY